MTEISMLDFIEYEEKRNADIMQRAGSTIGKGRREYTIRLNQIVDSMNREKREYDERLHSFYEKYCNVTPKPWTEKEKPSLKEKIYRSIIHSMPVIHKNVHA